MRSEELYMTLTPHVLSACVSKPGDITSAKQMADAIVRECVSECARLGLLDDYPVVTAAPAPVPSEFGTLDRVMAAPPAPVAMPVQDLSRGPQGLVRFVQAEVQGNGGIPVVPVGQPHQPAQHYNVVSGVPYVQPSAQATQSAAPWYPPHLAHLHRPDVMPQAAAPPPVAHPAQIQASALSDVPWYPPHLAHLHQKAPSPAAAVPVVGQPSQVPSAQVATGAGVVASQMRPYDVGGTKIVPPTGSTFQPPNQAGVMNNVVHVATPQGHSALGTDGVIAQPIQRPNSQDTVVAPGNQSVITQAGGAGTQFVPERISH